MMLYFPWVGGLIGMIVVGMLYLCSNLFPWQVSVALCILTNGLVTGMLHEDALSDVMDSMGGYDRKRKWEIMKDSRLGTFGAYGLILSLLLRYSALCTIQPVDAWKFIIAGMSTSRLAGAFLLVSTKPSGQAGSLASGIGFHRQWRLLCFGFIHLFVVLCLLQPNLVFILWVLIPAIVIPQFMRFYFFNRLGGVNGDCAGSVIITVETVLFVLASSDWI